MATASSTSARPRSRAARRPPTRLRWDRLGRVAMLIVLAILLYLYMSPVRALWSAIHESSRRKADVAALQRANKQLRDQRNALLTPGNLDLQARRLGLVHRGERPYVITNLPNN
jgi:Septum formation initiator